MRAVIEAAFGDAAKVLDTLRADAQALDALARIADTLVEVLSRRGRVLACGNGGSLADALHFAEEWTGRFRADRPPYAVLALGEATHMTCVANDFGFEHVFARQVEALGLPGDVLVLLSSSGNSPSIVKAAEAARAQGMRVVGFLGRDGGAVLPLCHEAVVFPGETSDRIQELHMLSLHALIEAAEKGLGHA